jgi:hypothetical protein
MPGEEPKIVSRIVQRGLTCCGVTQMNAELRTALTFVGVLALTLFSAASLAARWL